MSATDTSSTGARVKNTLQLFPDDAPSPTQHLLADYRKKIKSLTDSSHRTLTSRSETHSNRQALPLLRGFSRQQADAKSEASWQALCENAEKYVNLHELREDIEKFSKDAESQLQERASTGRTHRILTRLGVMRPNTKITRLLREECPDIFDSFQAAKSSAKDMYEATHFDGLERPEFDLKLAKGLLTLRNKPTKLELQSIANEWWTQQANKDAIDDDRYEESVSLASLAYSFANCNWKKPTTKRTSGLSSRRSKWHSSGAV